MEDYDEFVQLRLRQLREKEDSQAAVSSVSSVSNGSSLIRFYGRPILPPLLSGTQREEMRGHRDAVQRDAVQGKFKADARVAYVQTILQSVQLRKTPTLEEFFQGSGPNTFKSLSSYKTTNGSVSQSDYVTGTEDSLSFSPPSDLYDGKADVIVPPLTSTTYSAFSTYCQEECLIGQNEETLESQPEIDHLNGSNLHSVTSGYMTYENDKNTTAVSGTIEDNNTCGFFLHNTSNTITNMPDIISHPPIDGEELEKGAQVLSHCNNCTAGDSPKGICSTSVQQDSLISAHSAEQVPSDGPEERRLSSGKSDSSHLESTQCEDNSPFSAVDVLGQDQNHEGNEGPVSSVESCCLSGEPELLQTLATHGCSTSNLPQIQHELRGKDVADNQECETELNPPEEPYRLSLQALLKKSQEYRRQQRMLRNQAKNYKIQERTQERTRGGEEEQNLSDKENDEFPCRGTITAEGKKTREKSATVFPSVEASPRKPWENEQRREGIFVKEHHGKKAKSNSEITGLNGDGNTETPAKVQGEPASTNNCPSCSQEVMTEHHQACTFSQPQPVILTDNSPVQEAFYLTCEQSTTCPPSRSKEAGKYQTVPAPLFCMSPIYSKGKGSIRAAKAIDGADAPKSEVLVITGLNINNKVESKGNLGHKNSQCPAVSPTVRTVGEGDVSRVLAKCSAQAQQIDQLEMNLSCLKELISDLESTLTENRENHSQAVCDLHSDICHKDTEQSDQIKNGQHVHNGQKEGDYWDDRPRDSDDRNHIKPDEMDSVWQRRQLFDNYKNKHKETGPNTSIGDPENLPFILQERVTEAVNAREVKLVKTSTAETRKVIETSKGAQTTLGAAPCRVPWSDRAPQAKDLSIMGYGQHKGCKKQQPPAKCITSLAQRMRIPEMFRKDPSEASVPHKGSVLSDTSNQPTGRRTEMAVQGEDTSRSLSLNQSYDVDTPSGLWLLEGSGSSLSSKDHVQEKDLTPESGGEGQAVVSKVKRRLLMHEDRTRNTSGQADLVVRPNSNTPKDSVWCYEGNKGQKDKQQQLKQAHAAQVRALQEEHRRQQQELLQLSSFSCLIYCSFHFNISQAFPIPNTHIHKHHYISLISFCCPLSLISLSLCLSFRHWLYVTTTFRACRYPAPCPAHVWGTP
ncbi:uncharacterized protein cp110 isoform X2 [Myripristis murdjan]|uniref:uncharacterized protein cp110 isoform X2 n=1 Tax=Myripristis murdjan TaxID=586833 RepID=UPI001175D058|nr:uncharacterized protein LOC115364686 isoform X2 [Myripristis murdjan]